MSFEDEYAVKRRKKSIIHGLLPVFGLILAVALGAIAWVASEPLHELVVRNMPQFPYTQEGQWMVAGITWLLLLLVSGMLYALLAPKPPKIISERQLGQERRAKQAEIAAKRKRRKQIARKVSEERQRAEKKR